MKIFVVGNSRSGTHMISQILGRHSRVFMFWEIHFFEELWSGEKRELSAAAAVDLAARLMSIQRDGYLTPGDWKRFRGEASEVVGRGGAAPNEIFENFLVYETRKNGKEIPCEHTPRNLFYARDIMELYGDAKIVNMVRDPRDVLMSQRNKWRLRYHGYETIPRGEALRSWINYHPFTISVLWNASVRAGDELADHTRARTVRFEDLVKDPERRVREICDFLQIDYEEGMVDIPRWGSSHEKKRTGQRGIDEKAAGRWKRDGMSRTEMYICERVTKAGMISHGYLPTDVRPSYLKLAMWLVIWPAKTAVAFVANLGRMRNPLDTIRRRLRRCRR